VWSFFLHSTGGDVEEHQTLRFDRKRMTGMIEDRAFRRRTDYG
jgi:hypothetical protein